MAIGETTRHRTYYVGCSTLRLEFGDITTSKADVLVSSDDYHLTMGGGVSAAIRRAAGQTILLEVAKRIPVKLGDVVVTSAGSLPAKHVFHAITIGPGDLSPSEVVETTLRLSLKLLVALGLSSIALPAIGTGVARFSHDEVAVQMASILVDELSVSSEPLFVTIYLFDRYGQREPVDYLKFFEEFAARTRGLAKIPSNIASQQQPKPNDRQGENLQDDSSSTRSAMLQRLATLERERQELEGRLARYSGALPHREIRTIEERLKEIQSERVSLLSAPNSRPSEAVSVFVSYSHADENLRIELGKHLSVLERQGLIKTWHDRMIRAGNEWEGTIDRRLDEARVVLLLISADFIHSRYCYDVEMKRALERHDRKEALVVPIILRAVVLKGTPFTKLQLLPRDGKPVTTWPDRDTAYVEITDGLKTAIEDLAIGRSTP